MNKKILFGLISVLFIIIIAILIWQLWPEKTCPMIAIMCPDGSIASMGPDCKSICSGEKPSEKAPYLNADIEGEVVSLDKDENVDINGENPVNDKGTIKITSLTITENFSGSTAETLQKNLPLNTDVEVIFTYSIRPAKIRFFTAETKNSSEERVEMNPREEVVLIPQGINFINPVLEGNYLIYNKFVSESQKEIILPGLEVGSNFKAKLGVSDPEGIPYLEVLEYEILQGCGSGECPKSDFFTIDIKNKDGIGNSTQKIQGISLPINSKEKLCNVLKQIDRTSGYICDATDKGNYWELDIYLDCPERPLSPWCGGGCSGKLYKNTGNLEELNCVIIS